MTNEEFREAIKRWDIAQIEHTHAIKTFIDAVNELVQLKDGTHPYLTLCVRREHTPQHEGDTGYYYYEPFIVQKGETK